MNYSNSQPVSQDDCATKPKIRSKKVPKRRRRTVKRDLEIIRATRISGASGVKAISGPLVATHTPLKPANDDTPAKPVRLHLWEHTTDVLKATIANRVLFTGGPSVAFSLDLSPTQVKAANDNAKGFVDHFKRRISRSLKREFGYLPDHWFSVHSKAGRLHLHGTMAIDTQMHERAGKALCLAGGKWEASAHADKQLEFRKHYDPDGWASYCLNRDYATARRMIGRAVSITGPLRGRARPRYIAIFLST